MKHRYLAGAVLVGLLGACSSAGDGTIPSPYVFGGGPYNNNDPNGFGTGESPPTSSSPPTRGPAPQFGATRSLADAPPPLSGGTMILTQDQTRLVAADPDRDQVYLVTLADQSVVTVPLQHHDEPGRVVEDASGQAHVVLRGGGAIATIDLASGTVLSRRTTCPETRGIAFDPSASRLVVACAGGQVVQMGTASDAPVTSFAQLDRDLRDVVVVGSSIFVSHFRSGAISELDASGSVLAQHSLTVVTKGPMLAHLGWRMIAPPTGGTQPILVHQASTMQSVSTLPGGYDPSGGGGGNDAGVDVNFGAIVASFVNDGTVSTQLPNHAVLPVDIATDGTTYVIVAAGNGHTKELPPLFTLTKGGLVGSLALKTQVEATSVVILPGTTGSSALNVAVLSRQPAEIVIGDTIIPLSSVSREDTGHALFHSNSGSGIACASCHAEGRDDGHVWSFDTVGARRTPSMLGTLNGTAPYHWDGDQADISVLVDNVMTGRMNGPQIPDDEKGALQSWLFALPGPVAPANIDAAAASRGQALFTSPQVGCATCHTGERFTSSLTVDVGTGGRFQVPSLIGVGARAPYLHDGRAATLTQRFSAAGGGDLHGVTSSLNASQISDLVTYLNTL